MKRPAAKEVLAALGKPDAWDGAPKGWDEAMNAMPESGFPFLRKDGLAERCAAAGIAPDRAALLAPVIDEIERDPVLLTWAWYMHWRVYAAPHLDAPWGAPEPRPQLGARVGLFHLLLSLEWPSRLAAFHRTLGYPGEVTQETIQEIACYEAMHIRGEGGPGMYSGMYGWLSTYLTGPFVRLGRFEYQMHAFDGGFTVLRRPSNGDVLALADDGGRVGDDGLRLDDDAPAGAGWRTTLKIDDAAFTGNPIDPAGRILRHTVSVGRPEWQAVLREGDDVIDLHIPYGGGMGWDKVADSLKRAATFFPRYHPDRPVRAVVLSTWFMDPSVPEVLGPESNPARFQRACYMVPSWPDPGGLWFVFLKSVTKTPPDELPAGTSVQRALIGFLKGGGRWSGGSMFMLPEEMADPRLDVYRERFATLRSHLDLIDGFIRNTNG